MDYYTKQDDSRTQFLPATEVFHPLPLSSVRLLSMWSSFISKDSVNRFFHSFQWVFRIWKTEEILPKDFGSNTKHTLTLIQTLESTVIANLEYKMLLSSLSHCDAQ